MHYVKWIFNFMPNKKFMLSGNSSILFYFMKFCQILRRYNKHYILDFCFVLHKTCNNVFVISLSRLKSNTDWL